MPDEKSAPGGDLAALLRSAGDVAGLSADRAARQRDHEQSAGAAHERGEERMGQPKRDEAERVAAMAGLPQRLAEARSRSARGGRVRARDRRG